MIISQRRRYLEYQKEQEKKKRPHYKYIYYNPDRDKYTIRKSINGKVKHIKNFDDLNSAIEYRDHLIANNWNKPELSDEEAYKINHKEYYKGVRKRKEGRRFRVLNYKGDYLGECTTLEEALYFRDQYFHKLKEDVPKPSTLDLITDNKYFEGLEYPIPERLLKNMNLPKRNWCTGSIVQKSRQSYHVTYKHEIICNCRTYEQAYYVKQELTKNNWDTSKLDEILSSYPVWYTWLMKFYRYININKEHQKRGKTRYEIVIPKDKLDDGKTLDKYTNYRNLEDALFERDFLMDHDWDYDLLIECIDDTNNPYYDMTLPPYPERKIRNLRERDYHTEDLTEMHYLIQEGYNQHEIAEVLGVQDITIRNWLKKFYNTTFQEFKDISLSGENPLNVLEKVPHIYTPDLSIQPASNFKNYIHKNGSKKNPYRIVYNRVAYGSYSSRKQAMKVVNKLKACNWDKKQLPIIQKELGYKPRVKRNHIYPYGENEYQIRHNKNNKNIYYGHYKNYNLTCMIRDLLKENDWDKELLPDIVEQAKMIYGNIQAVKNNMFNGNSNTCKEYYINYFENQQHYRITDKGYEIIYYDDEKETIQSYGHYKDYETTLATIDCLMDNNWDREVLELVKEIA